MLIIKTISTNSIASVTKSNIQEARLGRNPLANRLDKLACKKVFRCLVSQCLSIRDSRASFKLIGLVNQISRQTSNKGGQRCVDGIFEQFFSDLQVAQTCGLPFEWRQTIL